jgi:hypothetical protein
MLNQTDGVVEQNNDPLQVIIVDDHPFLGLAQRWP